MYYFLIFAPFGVLGTIALLSLAKKRLDGAITRKEAAAFAAVALVISFTIIGPIKSPIVYARVSQSELMQCQFAEIIVETPADKTADELGVPYLYEDYDSIATSSQMYEELELTYLLFWRIS